MFRLRWPEGFRCPRYQHGEAYFHRPRHLYHCKACGYQASLTAGTVFHKTRTPLTKWFWMIWLMGRQKSGISMLSLQRMLEIKTYKTVWTSLSNIALDLIYRSVLDLPLNEPAVAAQRYEALTAEQVRAAFAKYLRPGDLLQVVQGPAPH